MDTNKKKLIYLVSAFIVIFPFIVNGWINSHISKIPLLYWSFEFATWVFIPSAVFIYLSRSTLLKASDIGMHTLIFGRSSIALTLLTCVIWSPIDFSIYKILYFYASEAFPGGSLFEYNTAIPDSRILKTLVIIYFALTAGIVEEVIYRGFILHICDHFSCHATIYLLISSSLFALVHWESGLKNVVATFGMGIITALLYLRIRNFWPLIVGHVFTDYLWFS